VNDIVTNSVSAIYTPPLNYLDSFISFNQHTIKYEQGFIFNEVEALNKTIDITVNNGTIQVLTDIKQYSDFTDYNKNLTRKRTLTTPLIFNVNNSSEVKFVTVIYEREEGLPANRLQYAVEQQDLKIFSNNILFELEFLSDVFLRVKHNNGTQNYFLTLIDQTLRFNTGVSSITSITAERPDMFRYSIDEIGYLQLYKNTPAGMAIVSLSGNQLVLQPLTSQTKKRDSTTLMRISFSYEEVKYNPDSAYVSYDVFNSNTLKIKTDKSSFSYPTQFILYTPLSLIGSEIITNILPLQNNFSEKGFVKRGTNMIGGFEDIPKTQFREYTNLFTGNDQEGGNDNISLTYVFFDKDIKVENGRDTFFKTPSSIYPYERLNINDTTFIDNGALAGNSPLLADKIFSRKHKTQLYNNGRYLFTWLSAANPTDKGLWVDRYYYPDATKKLDQLVDNDSHNSSFLDNVDSTNLGTSTRRRDISNVAFFDKRSDLVIEPNTTIGYRRIGEEGINHIVESLSPAISSLDTIFSINNTSCDVEPNSSIFNGTTYAIIDKQTTNTNQQFTISFDMFVDPSEDLGFQLMGNKLSQGFSLRTNQLYTPFIYNYFENKLYIYNTEYKLLSITEFDATIKDLVVGDVLDDMFVVCENGFIYKINAAGIKLKLSIVPDIVGYINFLQEKDSIIFLLPDTLTSVGNCISVDKNNFEVSNIVTQPLNIYSGEGPNVDFAQSIIRHRDILYRVPAEISKKPKSDSDYVFFAKNGINLIRYNLETDELDLFLRSQTRILDFTFDDNESVLIAHGNRITQVSKSRELLNTLEASETEDVFIGVDFVKYSSQGRSSSFVSGITYSPSGKLSFVKIEADGPENDVVVDIFDTPVLSGSIDFTSRIAPRFPQTNFNYIKNTASEANLTFNLTLHNYLNTEDIIKTSIEVGSNDIDKGIHSFSYRFDSVQGNITLFIDGKKFKNITVQPGKYKIQEALTDNFYIGTVGFINGIDLATYLDQPGYFYTSNLKIDNFFMFNSALYDDIIMALSLYNKPINTLVLSIPAGQRNNIEEIERYFKFGSVTSSKGIDIVIKNLNISSDEFKDSVEQSIREQAESVIPVGVTINNITFANYR